MWRLIMSRFSLSEMGVDLTSELARLMKLSVNDYWRIGASFIRPFSEAIIKNDIKKIRALTETFYNISCPQPDKWYARYEKEFLPIFDAIKRKLFPICTVQTLVTTFEIQSEYEGWGDVIVKELNKIQLKGIHFINPDKAPYRYADYGIVPIIEEWGIRELEKNECPFSIETFYDVFFGFVESVRYFDEQSANSDYYDPKLQCNKCNKKVC